MVEGDSVASSECETAVMEANIYFLPFESQAAFASKSTAIRKTGSVKCWTTRLLLVSQSIDRSSCCYVAARRLDYTTTQTPALSRCKLLQYGINERLSAVNVLLHLHYYAKIARCVI